MMLIVTVMVLLSPATALVPAADKSSTSPVNSTLNHLSSRVLPAGIVTVKGTQQVEDTNFDVVEPNPELLASNQLTDGSPTKSVKQTKKVRKWEHHQHRHHKNHHHHHHKDSVEPSAKSPSSQKAKQHFWSKNDILSSVTSTPATPFDVLNTCDRIASGMSPQSCPPPFRLLERRKEYEIRWYPSHKWASAIIMTEAIDDRLLAFWEGLSKLEDYFDGYNEPAVPMNLTYPFLTQMRHGKHPGLLNQELRDITLSVPVPAKHQISPPIPISSDVLLDVIDASTVFVQSFRARLWEMTERSVRQRAEKFMTTLRNHGEAFHDRYFYLAAFTKPDNTENNLYEMWIHATRLRDPGRVKPAVSHHRDPPLNKLTSRTQKKLCRGVECPSFDVLRAYKFGIQKRRYFDTVLVQASTTECEFNSLSVWRGFMPLHLYKHGINSHWEVLETTRPIGIVHIEDRLNGSETTSNSNATSYCKHDMTVSLYLPQRLHSNPPMAGIGAPAVKINRVNDLIVYVQTVGGSILDPVRSSIEVRKFASRLQSLGLCFKRGEYYLVIYDFMVRFHGRQNEIWMLADRCPSSATTSRRP